MAERSQADTRRTHGGQPPGTRPEHIAASFFSKREPHSKLFGEKSCPSKRKEGINTKTPVVPVESCTPFEPYCWLVHPSFRRLLG